LAQRFQTTIDILCGSLRHDLSQ